jgi:hypothetical protein
MKALRVIGAVVVLLAIGMFVNARLRSTAAGVYSSKPVRIVSLERLVNPDGSSTIRSVNIRWVTEDGAWKLIKLDPQGRSSVALYSDGDGLFVESKDHTVWQKSKRTDGEGPHVMHPSVEGYLNSKQFAREDQICGYRAFVLKNGDASNYTEVWYIPEVGKLPAKVVIHTAGQPDVVDEAIKIEFVPVSAQEVKRPDGPVSEKFLKKTQ